MKLNSTTFIILTILTASFNTFKATAQEKNSRTEHFNLHKGIALKGFDPVTFFTQKKPIRANGSISYTQNGVKYFFVCNNNLSNFKENPARYEAQYGGWCAYNMSKDGQKVTSSPHFFAISNDKLYFFHSKEAKQKWLATKGMKKQADDNWASITNN